MLASAQPATYFAIQSRLGPSCNSGDSVAERRFNRLRGAIGNAFVFAAGWTISGFVLWLLLRQARVIPDMRIIDGIGMSIKVGFMGFITGAAFPSIMRLVYRGKRIQEINWWKFALAGAVVAAVFVPTFMQVLNIISGDGMVAWSLIDEDIVLAFVLGGFASAVSIKLAQYADKLFPDTVHEQFERIVDNIDQLNAGQPDSSVMNRFHAKQRDKL